MFRAAYAAKTGLARKSSHAIAEAVYTFNTFDTYTIFSASDISSTAVSIAHAAGAGGAAAVSSAVDYDFLLQKNEKNLSDWWNSQALWRNWHSREKGSEPAGIKRWRQAFDKELRQLELDFLADDLNCLWDGKPLGAHAQNYLKNFSL